MQHIHLSQRTSCALGRVSTTWRLLPLWALRFWWTPRKFCWPWTPCLCGMRVSWSLRRLSKTQCSPRRTQTSGKWRKLLFHLWKNKDKKVYILCPSSQSNLQWSMADLLTLWPLSGSYVNMPQSKWLILTFMCEEFVKWFRPLLYVISTWPEGKKQRCDQR